MSKKKQSPPVPRCALYKGFINILDNDYVVGSTGRMVCRGCLEMSFHILEASKETEKENVSAPSITPQYIVQEVNKAIIGQEQAKSAVALAVWKQMLRANGDNFVPRTNLLLYGPSGCGKTAIIREAARIAGLPFLAVDATGITETDYRGKNAADIVTDLLTGFKGHPHVRHAIIFIDEVDKLSAHGADWRQAYCQGTQHALLKLVEGMEVTVDGMTINSTDLLFLFGGAFGRIDHRVVAAVEGVILAQRHLVIHAGKGQLVRRHIEHGHRVPPRLGEHILQAPVLTSDGGALVDGLPQRFRLGGRADEQGDACGALAAAQIGGVGARHGGGERRLVAHLGAAGSGHVDQSHAALIVLLAGVQQVPYRSVQSAGILLVKQGHGDTHHFHAVAVMQLHVAPAVIGALALTGRPVIQPRAAAVDVHHKLWVDIAGIDVIITGQALVIVGIYPNMSFIESGHSGIVMDKIRKGLTTSHIGFVYEEICQERMWELNVNNAWPFQFSKLGGYWDAKNEIDIAALDPEGKNLILGECKYWKEPVGLNVLHALEAKACDVAWERDRRKVWYVLFSISGFSDELRNHAASRDDLLLIDDGER